ncbi:40S ribosomal protein S3-3-like protein [Corchorus capsularis]|uniref:40S ribosomal protein S3-3-like protein n=1 Tax=Corchorus capsularis TaxID=210143 RepID=A0A1R3HZK7_COCAP|nr:40S ribosomal protein S3-3-like protein [Corchorus capsularis]
MAAQISKKRNIVADGVFFVEFNEVLTRELAEDGYSGVEVNNRGFAPLPRLSPFATSFLVAL